VIPTAKKTSDAITIPIPIHRSRRPLRPSASFGCAIAAFWIRKATTSGGQHHPNSKAHERFFECGKISSEAFSLVRNGESA
jgi:hypothetical protein